MMPPFGATVQVNSCPTTHTNTFIDMMSRTRACDRMSDIFLNKYLTHQIALARLPRAYNIGGNGAPAIQKLRGGTLPL